MVLSLGMFFELYDMLYTGYIVPGLIRGGLLTTSPKGVFDPSGVANFIASLFVGLFVGTMLCGYLADRYGRRRIFICALLWYAAANTIMAFQQTAWGLDAWRFVAGIGLGLEIVTIAAYTTEWVPPHVRGRAFACVQAVGFLAVPVAAALAYALVPHAPWGWDGWRWVVLMGALGALFAWWMRRELPESPRWLAQQGRLDEAERLVSDWESKIQAEYGRPLPEPGIAIPVAQGGGFGDLWRPPYRRRVVMLSLFNIFQVVGFYGFSHWVPTLIAKQGIAVTSSMLYASVIAIAAPVGPLLGCMMADRVERKTMIVAMAAMCAACGMGFSQTTNPAMLIALGMGLTLATNVMSYSYHAYQAEIFPTGIRARAVGLVYAWSRLSSIFVAFIIASTLRQFGSFGVFVLISGAMVIVMVVIGAMGPRTRGRSLDAIAEAS